MMIEIRHRALPGALVAAVLLVLAGGVHTRRARAVDQPSEAVAGLVVQLGDGTVRDFCVGLGADERTGIELLRLSGIEVIAEDTPLGSMVCRIGGDGCRFPDEPCWCRCQDLGADCTYWSYNTLVDGRWVYSDLGPAARTVRHGDVDGWAWGRGSVSSGAQPPARTFERVCAARLAPAATLAPPPASTTASEPLSPTPQPAVTPPGATDRPARAAPATIAPPRTGGADATFDAELAATATDVPDLGFPESTLDPQRRATVTAGAATMAVLLRGLAAAGATKDAVLGTAAAVMATATAAAAPPTAGVVPARLVNPAAEHGPSGGGGTAGRGGRAGYAVFAAVMVVLGGAWVWLRNPSSAA